MAPGLGARTMTADQGASIARSYLLAKRPVPKKLLSSLSAAALATVRPNFPDRLSPTGLANIMYIFKDQRPADIALLAERLHRDIMPAAVLFTPQEVSACPLHVPSSFILVFFGSDHTAASCPHYLN